jgi:signal transduction histidine kinase
VTEGLVRVLQKVHAGRGLQVCVDVDPRLAFAGESQDLQEMLGNLLDNACKAAHRQVVLSAMQTGTRLRVSVDDDGPGIAPDQVDQALARGRRLDESTPGSGLGLAIVQELATLYEGQVALGASPLGGLSVVLNLPAA